MNRRLRQLICLWLSGTMLGLPACVSPVTTGEQKITEPQVLESINRYTKEYVIAPGDRLEITVRGHPEINNPNGVSTIPGVLVRSDGYITVPMANEVKAAGLTFPELREKLTQALSRRLKEPEVTVAAGAIREPMVYVVGEVAVPRPVPLHDASTAAQAIALAGGFKHSAEKKAVAVIRLADNGHLRAYKIPVSLKGQPGQYMALQTMVLQPDDLIMVPESNISQFDTAINDYINQPLTGVNSMLAPVANILLIRYLINHP